MKKIAGIAVAAFLATSISAAYAQSGDNPGGRGVTSTGGPMGVTGKTTDGATARPQATTGMSGGSSAEVKGNTANSAMGKNSPNSLSTGSASPAGGGEK